MNTICDIQIEDKAATRTTIKNQTDADDTTFVQHKELVQSFRNSIRI